jgi:hypothetical protein
MFVEVDSSDMVVGVKYAILVRHDAWSYRTGIFKAHLDNEQTFDYMKEHSGIVNIDTYCTLRNMQNMDKHISYYAFVPQKERVTQAMEQRGVHKILKQLINDDFTW